VKRSARAIGAETEGCCLEYEVFGHIAKYRFMPNYLVWHQHGEVQAAAPAESDGSDDEDRMDDMIANIGMEYDLGSRDQYLSLEVQNFYRLLYAHLGPQGMFW
jgi:hypothetical protein